MPDFDRFLTLKDPLKLVDPFRALTMQLEHESSAIPTAEIITPIGHIAEYVDPIIEFRGERFNTRRAEFLKNWSKAETVVLICGSHGLGDALSWARAALFLRKITDKKIIVQAQDSLAPVLRTEGVTVVESISTSFLSDTTCFFISLDPYNDLSAQHTSSWLQTTPKDHEIMALHYPWIANNPDALEESALIESYDLLRTEPLANRFYDHDAVFGQVGIRAVWNSDIFPEKEPDDHLFHSYLNMRLKLLTGERFNPHDYSAETLVLPALETLPPQDIDLLIMPDAKEGPDPSDPSISMKMIPLETLVESVATVVQEKKLKTVAILKGVSHPEFCQELFKKLQERLGITITLLEGSLTDVAQKMVPRAKNVFVMDSITAHLSSYVRDALRKNRDINVIEYFNSQYVHADAYTIPGTPTLVLGNELFRKRKIVLANLPSDSLPRAATLLAHPRVDQISDFLRTYLKE